MKDNITLNGKSIDLEHFDEETDKEVRKSFTEELKSKKKIIYIPHKRKYAAQTKKVSKRVRHLSAQEIRKEYGLMALPYKRTAENVLWIIINQGPVTTSQIAEKIGKSIGSISGLISEMYSVLGKNGKNVMIREQRSNNQKGYRYSFVSDYSVEAAYRGYREGQNRRRKQVPAKRLPAPQDVADAAVKSLRSLAGSQARALDVEVNVKVEVLFGIKK